ncbi:MAG TPA: tetratricopeptide repeat protein [Candidatus Sulfotelmatobacter sp.]
MYSTLAKTGLVLAACLVSGMAWASCAGPPSLETRIKSHADAPAYVDLGNWFGDHHQYDCAAEAFRSALKFEPTSASLYYLVGLSLFSSGHAEEAVGALQQSIQIAPDEVKSHLILGAALEQAHRNKEAMTEWVAALKIDPHSTEAIDWLSKGLVAEGDFGDAIALLRSAPRDENLTIRLAEAYDKAGMLDKAADVLKPALNAKPSSLPLTEALTTILVKQTLYQDAIRLAAKAAKLHPGNLEAERQYFRLLVLNDDYALATPLGQKLLIRAPHDFDILYLNGIMERAAGKFPTARKHLEEAVRLQPNHYNARYNLGVVLSELNDASGAKEQLEKAIELGASEPEIRFTLASALRTLGEADEANQQLKLYQQELQAKNNRTLAASKAAQGDKELATGDPQKAVAFYREAVTATPKDILLSFKLALALDRTGNIDEERTLLEQAVKVDPSFALAQNQLGYLASRSGDSASAEEHFRNALRAAPGYTQAWVSLAATLGMESRFPEAQQAVASALKLDPQNAEALQLRKDLEAAQTQH